MIRLQHVTRWFGSTRAVDDVSFEVQPGQIAGFLGPNGAGKSTVLKMISTWLPPSEGRVEVAGFDTQTEALAVRRHLGYLPEHNALYDSMRVDRLLRFVARMHGLGGARLRARLDEVIGRTEIGPVQQQLVRTCSKGYRQRVGVACALVHDPAVIVLDEPTHGLDPLQVVAFRHFLESLREGRTILFSSHILSEVLALSDRVLVIQKGRLLTDTPTGTLEEQAHARGSTVEEVILDVVRQGTLHEATP